METKIADLERKIDTLMESVASGFEAVSTDLKAIEKRLDILKGKSESNLDTIDEGFITVTSKLDDIINELKKVNAVTSYDAIHKNLPKQGEA